MARQRPVLVSILSRRLAGRPANSPPPPVHDEQELPAEEWPAGRRARANLVAMELAAREKPAAMTHADRLVLGGYSGWAGLSIDRILQESPAGSPVPDERGLIHQDCPPRPSPWPPLALGVDVEERCCRLLALARLRTG